MVFLYQASTRRAALMVVVDIEPGQASRSFFFFFCFFFLFLQDFLSESAFSGTVEWSLSQDYREYFLPDTIQELQRAFVPQRTNRPWMPHCHFSARASSVDAPLANSILTSRCVAHTYIPRSCLICLNILASAPVVDPSKDKFDTSGDGAISVKELYQMCFASIAAC